MRRRKAWREAPEDEEDHDHRMTVNLVAAIFCLVLLGAGLFIVEALHRAGKAQACIEAGRRSCPALGISR
jgi:hypothetical protein